MQASKVLRTLSSKVIYLTLLQRENFPDVCSLRSSATVVANLHIERSAPIDFPAPHFNSASGNIDLIKEL